MEERKLARNGVRVEGGGGGVTLRVKSRSCLSGRARSSSIRGTSKSLTSAGSADRSAATARAGSTPSVAQRRRSCCGPRGSSSARCAASCGAGAGGGAGCGAGVGAGAGAGCSAGACEGAAATTGCVGAAAAVEAGAGRAPAALPAHRRRGFGGMPGEDSRGALWLQREAQQPRRLAVYSPKRLVVT